MKMVGQIRSEHMRVLCVVLSFSYLFARWMEAAVTPHAIKDLVLFGRIA